MKINIKNFFAKKKKKNAKSKKTRKYNAGSILLKILLYNIIFKMQYVDPMELTKGQMFSVIIEKREIACHCIIGLL